MTRAAVLKSPRLTVEQAEEQDKANGAHYIPGEVTLARKEGHVVPFVNKCGPCCAYWILPDGSRAYQQHSYTMREIARANGRKFVLNYGGGTRPEGGYAGPCPKCGNPHTRGGRVEKDQIKF
jgi:hypothetical protein